MGGDGVSGEYVLSMNCTIANTTVVPVGCGSVVTGSTVGLSRKHHILCSNEFARVEASTSGSSSPQICSSTIRSSITALAQLTSMQIVCGSTSGEDGRWGDGCVRYVPGTLPHFC